MPAWRFVAVALVLECQPEQAVVWQAERVVVVVVALAVLAVLGVRALARPSAWLVRTVYWRPPPLVFRLLPSVFACVLMVVGTVRRPLHA